VIEQTVRETLPEGFQRSEFLLEHGVIDMIVDRRDMRRELARTLRMLLRSAGRRRRPMRSLNDWLAQQLAQHPKEIDLSLERVRAVAQRLGLLPWRSADRDRRRDERQGLDGCDADGARPRRGVAHRHVHLPHSQRYNERVAIDAVPIDDASLCAAFERIESARGRG
jgi:hypothetical protein